LRGQRDAPPAAADAGQRIIPSCDADSDSDGDHINDFYEGRIEDTPEQSPDADGDDIPNYLDAYSDGQGIPDIQQSASDLCAPPPDTDLDTVPDFLDIDNDGDGLTDAEELAAHTDPFDADSDDNGCVDAVDVSEGECDLKAHVRPEVPCEVRVFESRLELRVGNTFSGELTDVSVRVEYDQRLILTSGVLSVRVAPPESADSFSVYNGVLRSVRPGAVLTVGVIVSPPINNLFLKLSVQSESQGELARGSLAVIGLYGCRQPG
jgi:hypothetical protein